MPCDDQQITVNHYVNPTSQLVVNAGSDRSWVWTAFDFSEPEKNDGKAVEECFAIRLKDTDAANAYKAEYEKAQELQAATMAGADGEDTAAGDEAAAALEGLKTSE